MYTTDALRQQLHNVQVAIDDAFINEDWQQVANIDDQCRQLLEQVNKVDWQRCSGLGDMQRQIHTLLVSYRVLLTESIFRQRRLHQQLIQTLQPHAA